jgi:hypothetical protein
MRLLRLACAVVVAACVAPIACGGRESLEPPDDSTINATTPDPTSTQQATQQALMARWNAAATAAGTSIDFHWTVEDQFPHPTVKGGTAQAYQQFATVLLLFFQRGDDFAFLAQNHLFETPLRFITASGQVDVDTTFQKLATELSSSTGFGNIPDATRQALKGFLDRMN